MHHSYLKHWYLYSNYTKYHFHFVFIDPLRDWRNQSKPFVGFLATLKNHLRCSRILKLSYYNKGQLFEFLSIGIDLTSYRLAILHGKPLKQSCTTELSTFFTAKIVWTLSWLRFRLFPYDYHAFFSIHFEIVKTSFIRNKEWREKTTAQIIDNRCLCFIDEKSKSKSKEKKKVPFKNFHSWIMINEQTFVWDTDITYSVTLRPHEQAKHSPSTVSFNDFCRKNAIMIIKNGRKWCLRFEVISLHKPVTRNH